MNNELNSNIEIELRKWDAFQIMNSMNIEKELERRRNEQGGKK